MHISEALDHWLLALETEGRRPATLETYRWHWVPFIRWLETQDLRALDDLTPFVIRRWLSEYRSDHAPASVRSTFNSIQAFVNWAKREGILHTDPLKNVKPPKTDAPAKKALSAGEVRALLAALRGSRSATGLRNLALVAVILDTGARVSELCAVRLPDLVGDTIVLKRTKNGRPRLAFLGRRSEQALGRYLTHARPHLHPHDDLLFVSTDGEILTRHAVHNVLKRLSAHLGFKVTAHLLRHTWATMMARSGVTANALAALAGWSEIEMAQRYVHLTAEDLRRVHSEARPLDGLP